MDRAGTSVPSHLPVRLRTNGRRLYVVDGVECVCEGEQVAVVDAAVLELTGFAINDQGTEAGLTAVGVAVPPAGGFSGVALSLAAPSARYSRERLPVWAAALSEAAGAIARDLDAG